MSQLGMQAGVTGTDEAKTAILDGVSNLVCELSQELPTDTLDAISAKFGLAYEVKSGKISNVTFC